MAMDEDYFGAEDDAHKSGGEGAMPKEEEHKDEGGKTALLNKEVCPGMEVGSEITLRIVGDHDQEYEVEYLPSEKKEEPGEEKAAMPKEMAMGGGGDHSSMYE